jgi:hypothetical protein
LFASLIVYEKFFEVCLTWLAGTPSHGKKMMMENQQELLHAISPDDQMLFLRTHQELKLLEMQLTKQPGTVIYK